MNDGDSDSSAITSNVSVASVDDAPVISGVDVAISYTSGQSAQLLIQIYPYLTLMILCSREPLYP